MRLLDVRPWLVVFATAPVGDGDVAILEVVVFVVLPSIAGIAVVFKPLGNTKFHLNLSTRKRDLNEF